jgi:hypothetical protein
MSTKKLSAIKEDLKATSKLAVAETLKAYELFCCFVAGEAQTQWEKIIQEIHSNDPWVGVNWSIAQGPLRAI